MRFSAFFARAGDPIAQLRHEVGGIALSLAERVLGHELQNDDRQQQLVDDFIAGLESAPESGARSGGARALDGQLGDGGHGSESARRYLPPRIL